MSIAITKPEDAVAVLFKLEDTETNSGPVWFETPTDRINAYDSEPDWNGDPFPGWLPRGQAVDMARHFGLRFEEV